LSVSWSFLAQLNFASDPKAEYYASIFHNLNKAKYYDSIFTFLK